MFIQGRGSSSLNDLIALVDYLSDPKKRAKELKELREVRDEGVKERVAIEGTRVNKKKLADADDILACGTVEAAKMIAAAKSKADKLIKDAERKVGDLEGEQKRLQLLAIEFSTERTNFDAMAKTASDDLDRRDLRITKRENDLARGRDNLKTDQAAMRDKAQRVEHALRG